MSKKTWLAKPDTEDFWWVVFENSQRTVACVSSITCGIILMHLIGYRQEFTDLDIDTGSLRNTKWKKLPLT